MFFNKAKTSKFYILFLCSILVCAVFLFFTACAPGEYTPESKPAQLNKPDILQDGILKVGVNLNNPPLASEVSKPSGIDIDVASAIAEDLGLKVEFVDVAESPDLALEDNKCDIVMGLSKATDTTEIWKSNSYIQTACALFSKDSNATVPKSGSLDKFATVMASPSALAAQNQYNIENIKLNSTIEACFEQLDKGEVNFVATDAVVGTYNTKKLESTYNLTALLSKPSGYCIGANKSNKNLCDKVSASLENIQKGGILSVIEKRWLGKSLELDKVTLTDGASNQADASELEAGVYSQTHPDMYTP